MPRIIDQPAPVGDYDHDFYLWTQQQARALRDASRHRINEPIDWENVAEEIESLGKSDRREVQSLARNILIHLLKLRFSYRTDPRAGWKKEIRAWRYKLDQVLEDSPSLAAAFPGLAEAAWNSAVGAARTELEDNGEDAAELRAASYLGLVGPDASMIRSHDHFPEPPGAS
jgi:hypothetical protein